jgi:hypothetical protein
MTVKPEVMRKRAHDRIGGFRPAGCEVVPKSACRKFHQIGPHRRASVFHFRFADNSETLVCPETRECVRIQSPACSAESSLHALHNLHRPFHNLGPCRKAGFSCSKRSLSHIRRSIFDGVAVWLSPRLRASVVRFGSATWFEMMDRIAWDCKM